jgi:uncharacterized protein DUF3999
VNPGVRLRGLTRPVPATGSLASTPGPWQPMPSPRSWIPMRLLLAALLLSSSPTLAADSAREVLPAGAGPQRLELDAAVVSASAREDLGDLRLSDAAGREVPYLLVAPSAPAGRWAPGRIQPTHATRRESGFEVDLGAVRPVEQLRLDGLPEPFLKRFRLEGSGDRVRWTELVAEGTLFALPAEELRLLTVTFPRGEHRWLRLTWDDRSSARPPLPAGAVAFLPEPSPPSPAPLRVPLVVERRPGEPGVSRFALRLPGPRLPVQAVVLDVAGDRLHRRATVLEARLGVARLEPVVLGEATLRRVVRDGAGAEALRIPTSRPEELELTLRVEDGDSGPLPLAGAWAELAPLPWIYLEPAGPGPLVLRAGDTARAPPRYDLEAVRDGLATARPAAARLGAATPAPPPAAAPPLEAAGASVDAKAFRWSREVAAAPPGLAAVRLDAAVIARTRGLADLRLAGPDGRQIPYLLEQREEPLVVELAAPAPAEVRPLSRPGVTVLAVTLPEPSLPAARLVLTTGSRLFERRVRVHEDRPQAEGGPRLVAESAWRHADQERPAAPLTVPLPAVASSRLLLELDDGDNAPLPIGPPRLLLPGWRLRFLHPGVPLRLLHGADGVEAPRYDLALLAPRLRAAPAPEVALGPPAPPAAPPLLRPASLAWGALVVGVLAMLWLLARLVRRHP